MLRGKRVLIIGGFGYLGGRIGVALARDVGYIVRLGSRKSQIAPSWLPEAEIAVVDTCEPTSLSLALNDVHAVVHLAGMNANECLRDPSAALLVNGFGTMQVLQAAIDAKVERFIYFSTAHVYGSPLIGNITEETYTASLHPYATSHRAAEDVVRYAQESGKIEAIVIRLSNAYGPPTHKEANCWMLLVNDLCRQVVTTKKMVLNSSGLQRRDFIPITEVCHVVEHLLHIPEKDIGTGLFNAGGEWSPTVLEMTTLIQKRCEITLGFRPSFSFISQKREETSPVLNYGLRGLYKTRFKKNSNRVEEIDKLLEFCNAQFR